METTFECGLPREFGANEHVELTFRVDLRDGEVWTYKRTSWDISITQTMNDGDVIEFCTKICADDDVVMAVNAVIKERGFIEFDSESDIHNELIDILNAACTPLDDVHNAVEEGVYGSNGEFTDTSWEWHMGSISREWEREAEERASSEDD